MTVRVTVNNQAAFESLIKKMAEKVVYVGIRGGGERKPLSDFVSKKPSGKKEKSAEKEPTNAEIAYVNEFGSAADNIPPRPFLFPAVNKQKQKVDRIFQKNLKVALDELNPTHIDKTLEAVGTLVRDTAKLNITDGINMVPLSLVTLKLRKEAGFKGTKPLKVTGQLVGSIEYIVE